MKREFLKSLQLEDEVIEKVMLEHGKTIAAEQAKATSEKTRADSIEAQLTERDKDIAALKKNSSADAELQTRIQELQTKYETETAAHKQELSNLRIETALDLAISDSKGKNAKAIKALIDRSTIKLKDDGSVQGFDLDAIKKSDPYLFNTEDNTEPKFSGAAPAGRAKSASGTDAMEQEIDNILKGI